MKVYAGLAICIVVAMMGGVRLLARGEVAPPPYGAGLGNSGDWIPGGSLFGFDDPFGDGGDDGGGHGYGGFGWGFGGGSGRRDKDHLPNGGFNWSGILGGGGGGNGGGGNGGGGNGGGGNGGGGNGGGGTGNGGGGPQANSPCAGCLEQYCNYDLVTPGPGPVTFWENICYCFTNPPKGAKVGDPVTGFCKKMGFYTSGGTTGCCIPFDPCGGIVGR